MEPSTCSMVQDIRAADAGSTLARRARPPPRAGDARAQEKLDGFLRDVRAAGALPREIDAEDAAAATVWVLAEHLGGVELERLLAALPAPIGSLFEVFQTLVGGAPTPCDGHALRVRVAALLGVDRAQADGIARGVFRALRARVPSGAVDDVARLLSGDLRRDWLNVAPGERLPSGLVPATRSLDAMVAEVEAGARLPAGVRGVHAIVTVLGALADVLEGLDLTLLAEALPTPLRPMWSATGARIVAGSAWAPTFVSTIAVLLHIDEEPATGVARRVFAATRQILPEPFAAEVGQNLPASVRTLWG